MRSMKAIKAMNQKLKQAVEKQENVILDTLMMNYEDIKAAENFIE